MPFDTNFDQWIQGDDDSSTTLKFVSHLSSVRNLAIRSDTISLGGVSLLKKSTRKSLQEIRNASPLDMVSRLWQWVDALKEDRNMDGYTAKFALYDNDITFKEEDERILFQVDLEYRLHIKSYLECNIQLEGEESVKELQVTVKGMDIAKPKLPQLIANLFNRFTGLQRFHISLVRRKNAATAGCLKKEKRSTTA